MMRCIVFVFVALAACFAVSSATLGVSIWESLNLKTWQCLKYEGYEFAVVDCFSSLSGKPLEKCAENVANALSAGIKVDISMGPCPDCGSAKTQAQSLYNYTQANHVKFNKLWLEADDTAFVRWSNNHTKNRRFFDSLIIATAEEFGTKDIAGIHALSDSAAWKKLFGLDYDRSFLPLWWDHLDGEPSFSNFVPFANWTKPSMKFYDYPRDYCVQDNLRKLYKK